MTTIYVYVLDTMADWEVGYVTAELNSKRFFKEDAANCTLKTVSVSKKPIKTMGGLTILPDYAVDDIIVNENNVLILPGADTWSDSKHNLIIEKVKEFIEVGGTVAAICGATHVLANEGLLNERKHTSNGEGFLEMMCPSYQGSSFYIDQPSVSDDNLITAGSTGGLLWAKQIIERLAVFNRDTLEAWYNYFENGKAEDFFALMQTLPVKNASN